MYLYINNITNTNIENISCFDYIGFPLITQEGTQEGITEINRLFKYDKTKLLSVFTLLIKYVKNFAKSVLLILKILFLF